MPDVPDPPDGPPVTDNPGATAAQRLVSYFHNQLALSPALVALRVILAVLLSRLGYRTDIDPATLKPRPREHSLLDGAGAFITAKIEYPEEMAVAKFDIDRLKLVISAVAMGRDLGRTLTAMLSTIMNNVAVWENEIHTTLDEKYKFVRRFAQVHPLLSQVLEPTEEHLFGAAKLAAETGKATRREQAKSQAGNEGTQPPGVPVLVEGPTDRGGNPVIGGELDRLARLFDALRDPRNTPR